MTPAEILASVEEPDWLTQWRILECADDGFDAILSQWRKWHWIPIEIAGQLKKLPAPATDGIIALAHLGIMPHQRLTERPPGPFMEQHDAHMWFQSQGRAWRVWAILDGWLIVNSFGDEWHIDLVKAKWDGYVLAAAAALEKERPPAPPAEGLTDERRAMPDPACL